MFTTCTTTIIATVTFLRYLSTSTSAMPNVSATTTLAASSPPPHRPNHISIIFYSTTTTFLLLFLSTKPTTATTPATTPATTTSTNTTFLVYVHHYGHRQPRGHRCHHHISIVVFVHQTNYGHHYQHQHDISSLCPPLRPPSTPRAPLPPSHFYFFLSTNSTIITV